MDDITEFKSAEYSWLSNMEYCTIFYRGILFNSVEGYYQAMKFNDKATALSISKMNPYKAREFGKSQKITNTNFEKLKLRIMRHGLMLKFSQEPFKSKLLETGDRNICEGNWWGDDYWGVDIKTGIGDNHLGKLIMQIRQNLKVKEYEQYQSN